MTKLGKRLTSLALCAAILLTAGACAPKEDAVAATVGEEKIYKWEVDVLYEKNKPYYEAQTGLNLEENVNAEKKQVFKETLLEDLIKDTAAIIKAKQMGYDLTADEKAAVEKEFEDLKQRNIQYFIENDFKGQADAQKQAQQKYVDNLAANHLTEKTLLDSMYNNKVHEKMTNELYKDIASDDVMLKEMYDKMVSDQKERFDNNKLAYTKEGVIPGSGLLYTPEGISRVKYCMIGLPDDTEKMIESIKEEQRRLNDEAFALMLEKGEQETRAAQNFADSETLQFNIEQLIAEGLVKIEAKANEAAEAFKGGMSFEDLIKKYNTDPMMTTAPYDVKGILVYDDADEFDPAVTDAVKNLKPNEYSELIKGENGYYIVQLLGIETPGVKSYEDALPFLMEFQNSPVKQDLLMKFSAEALNEMKVERFVDRLK